jgi:hypothetical protein
VWEEIIIPLLVELIYGQLRVSASIKPLPATFHVCKLKFKMFQISNTKLHSTLEILKARLSL